MAGALVTVGTSAPSTPRVLDEQRIRVEDGAAVHFVVRVSRAAVVRTERFELSVSHVALDDAAEGATLTLTPDDAELATAVDEGRGTLLWLDTLDPLCPGEGDCDLGFELMLDSPSPFEVRVRAIVSRAPDGRFLFPENRDFPADATVELVEE